MSMRIIIILAALFIPAIAAAEGPTRAPYMTQEQFQFSGDKHTQAQTWATCAALYNTMATFNKDFWGQPAQAMQFNN